jgi:hypothetical protein
MIRNELLLQENPTYILAPNIELTQNTVTKADEENSEGPFNCDGCGKALDSPYYISIGIPPSPLIIGTGGCQNWNYEKNIDFEYFVSLIQSIAETFDIDHKYQWIFSEQNIRSSITRKCVDCKECFRDGRIWLKFPWPKIHIRSVCFAVKEYQRRHTPLSTARSDYERYILSLPDRTNLEWKHFGDLSYLNLELSPHPYYEDDVMEYLTVALIPDYRPTDVLSLEFRADFIQDKNRVIPNDQELTRWMKKCNDQYDNYDDWFRIQFCKIFVNPKTQKYPLHRDGKEVYNTKYTVIVHYSVPKGHWDEYDI